MMRHVKWLAGTAVMILALLLYFTRSAGEAFNLALPTVCFWLLPGYTLLTYLWQDADNLEKTVLAVLIGFGIVPFLLYYPTLFNLAIIKPLAGYVIAVLSVILLVLHSRKEAKQ